MNTQENANNATKKTGIFGIIWGRGGRAAAIADFHARRYAAYIESGEYRELERLRRQCDARWRAAAGIPGDGATTPEG